MIHVGDKFTHKWVWCLQPATVVKIYERDGKTIVRHQRISKETGSIIVGETELYVFEHEVLTGELVPIQTSEEELGV